MACYEDSFTLLYPPFPSLESCIRPAFGWYLVSFAQARQPVCVCGGQDQLYI
jgi:hypothetical protein